MVEQCWSSWYLKEIFLYLRHMQLVAYICRFSKHLSHDHHKQILSFAINDNIAPSGTTQMPCIGIFLPHNILQHISDDEGGPIGKYIFNGRIYLLIPSSSYSWLLSIIYMCEKKEYICIYVHVCMRTCKLNFSHFASRHCR